MNLGLAIFLSSLFIGMIWLYSFTKDKWNWKKYSKWIIASLIFIFIFLIIDLTTDGLIDGNFKKEHSYRSYRR